MGELTRHDLREQAADYINRGMSNPDKIAEKMFADLNGSLNDLMNDLIVHELREIVRSVIRYDRTGGGVTTSHRQQLVTAFGMNRPYFVPIKDDWIKLKDLAPADTASIADYYFSLAKTNQNEGDKFTTLGDEMRKRHIGIVGKLPAGMALEILCGAE